MTASTTLPECRTLRLRAENGLLHLTLHRPEVRNAMNLRMVEEVRAVFRAIRDDRGLRAVVLRGAEGHFCAGADLKELGEGKDRAGWVEYSCAFGRMLAEVEAAPQVVIALLEGAVLGGGFGLACVADVAIAEVGARFGMPETTRGIPPAQIAPFVVRRIGLSQARRLALLGQRFDAGQAERLGIVQQVEVGGEALMAACEAVRVNVALCAPGANAITKALLIESAGAARDRSEALIERAAHAFADALVGPEGREGTAAFLEKRPPEWAT